MFRDGSNRRKERRSSGALVIGSRRPCVRRAAGCCHPGSGRARADPIGSPQPGPVAPIPCGRRSQALRPSPTRVEAGQHSGEVEKVVQRPGPDAAHHIEVEDERPGEGPPARGTGSVTAVAGTGTLMIGRATVAEEAR